MKIKKKKVKNNFIYLKMKIWELKKKQIVENKKNKEKMNDVIIDFSETIDITNFVLLKHKPQMIYILC